MTGKPNARPPDEAWAQVTRYHRKADGDMVTHEDGGWCLYADIEAAHRADVARLTAELKAALGQLAEARARLHDDEKAR